MQNLQTLKDINVEGKVVLCRVDLNVPMRHGRVEDATRVIKIAPTIQELIKRKAKVVIISHFGRPKGQFVREMSLAPLADTLSEALDGKFVKFAIDCIDHHAQEAIADMAAGDVLLLENLRFYSGEQSNDPKFVKDLASLGDFYVNDTFSCSHRKHASIVGIAKKLPSAAGLLLQSEIENLEKALSTPKAPIAAIVGGSKISTKLNLIKSLINKVELLVIGGAMANTFLKATNKQIGNSLYEKDLVNDAKDIIQQAQHSECELFLPIDVIIAKELKERPECKVVNIDDVPNDQMILDLGPTTISTLATKLKKCRTIVWNGPLGAFEYRPFDVASITLAQNISALTSSENITSVAGGGDVVAALSISGLTDSFSYISTAGGAFLEWLQDNSLPGIETLCKK